MYPRDGATSALHVHRAVWRLDRHLGGNRAEATGTIGIGDVVYRAGPAGDCTATS